MTLMVRDEADIIRPMIEHSLAQGVDSLIVTDNASKDGTTEILESFGDAIDLRHDPEHRKQQYRVVTGMARDAFTQKGADWVINADADEFWLPRLPGRTIGEVFAELPRSLGSFIAPVVDMTGAPVERGTGLQRLRFRDSRSAEDLRRIGLFAHSTPDAVHVGSAEVEVSQGNHHVNIEQRGELPAELELEVLHFPWRSWAQFESKVVNSGRAYESNAALSPSPNHHGMREYLRWKLGALLPFYVGRHPSEKELAAGLQSGEFVEETRIADSATSPVEDVPLDPALVSAGHLSVRPLAAMEAYGRAETAAEHELYATAMRAVEEGRVQIESLQGRVTEDDARIHALEEQLRAVTSRRVVRATDRMARVLKREH